MPTFVATTRDVEMGAARSATFETLVAEPVGTSTSSCPAIAISTPDAANPTPTASEAPKRPDWTKLPRLDDLARYPKGLLRLAAQQTAVHNGSTHRRFEPEGEFLIHYWEYQVIFAASRVYEWHENHPEAGGRPPRRRREGLGKACDLDEYHTLVDELEHAWRRYDRLVIAQKEKRKLLNVHMEEVRGLYGSFLASQDMTDEDAFLPAYAPVQDFCSTALHQVHLPIRNLLYSDFGRWVQEKLGLLRFNEESGGFLLSLGPLSLSLEIFRIFLSSSLILVPVGSMMFAGLDGREMFGVVVACVAVFCAVVVLGCGVGAGESGGSGYGNGVFQGVVATYAAVLTAFLAQLEN